MMGFYAAGAMGGGTPSLTAQVQALFAKYSAIGGMWDFLDTLTMFQDSAGTTPVTTSSQPVGRVNDISGQGNRLHQTTSGARPAYNGAGVTPDGSNDFLVTVSNLDLTACDKVVHGMGYTKVSDTPSLPMEFSASVNLNSGSFFFVNGNEGGTPARYQAARARGTGGGEPSAGFTTLPANGFGAHIGRHSIPGDLSEAWWAGVKGTNSTGDKGSGTFGNYPLYLFSRAGVAIFATTPTRRAIVLGVPVASSQVSDTDIDLIAQWLAEGA